MTTAIKQDQKTSTPDVTATAAAAATPAVETAEQRQTRILREMGWTPQMLVDLKSREKAIMANGAEELAELNGQRPIQRDSDPVYRSKWHDIRDIIRNVVKDLNHAKHCAVLNHSSDLSGLIDFLTKNIDLIENAPGSSNVTKSIKAKLLLNLVQINPSFWLQQTDRIAKDMDDDEAAPNATSSKEKFNLDKINYYNNTRAKIVINPAVPSMEAAESILFEFQIDPNSIITPMAKAILARFALSANYELLRVASATAGLEATEQDHHDDDTELEEFPKVGAMPIQTKTIKEFRAWQKGSNNLSWAGSPADKKWRVSLLTFWNPMIYLWGARDLLKGRPSQASLEAAKKLLESALSISMSEKGNKGLIKDIKDELDKIPVSAQSSFDDLMKSE